MNHVLVSIVTVCLNSEKTIRDTLESVLSQTYDNIEYIIVDGVSKDSTLQIVSSYKEKFENRNISCQVISEKDNGLYDAMNKGIKCSHGEIIGIINSDDWYEKDAIETVVREYEAKRFDYAYGHTRAHRLDGKDYVKYSRQRKYITSRDWSHPSTFVTKAVYNKFLYDQGHFYEDFNLLLRVIKGKCKITIIDAVLANFRFGGVSNQKSIKKMIMRFKDRYSVYRDNGFSRLYILECLYMELGKFLFV